MNTNNFTEEDIKGMQPTEKVGIVATVNEDGLPHITLITTIEPSAKDKIILGQFSHGLSKQFIQKNNKASFLVMTLDKNFWMGKMKWTHLKQDGPEYEKLNLQPMFRYNTYFGINTVHYFDLVETTHKKKLPLLSIGLSAVLTKLAKGGVSTNKNNQDKRILNYLAESIFNNLSALKFLSYIDEEGFPVLLPIIQAQAVDSKTLVFSYSAFTDELEKIPENAQVAIFGLTLQMENVLTRGTLRSIKKYRGIKLGVMDIDWVYNSLPPVHGQIYPEVKLEAVENW